jgi:hypothetical protein
LRVLDQEALGRELEATAQIILEGPGAEALGNADARGLMDAAQALVDRARLIEADQVFRRGIERFPEDATIRSIAGAAENTAAPLQIWFGSLTWSLEKAAPGHGYTMYNFPAPLKPHAFWQNAGSREPG